MLQENWVWSIWQKIGFGQFDKKLALVIFTNIDFRLIF